MAKIKAMDIARGIGKFFKWFFIVLGTLLLVGALTASFLACYGVNYIQDVIMPQVQDASLDLVEVDTSLSSNIYYYDSETESYQNLQTLYAGENRVWVTYEDIPKTLVNATVAIEDKRFWEHNGVDWRRTAAAVFYMFTGKSVQGGSTITQQLIKNVTQENQVTVKRKVLEIFKALEFDKTHSKESTLEWYLNEIYLGRRCYGVVTAAQLYFGKELKDLTLAECASLISITNNPSLYDPYSRPEKNHSRAAVVVLQMLDQGMISQEEADAALDELGMVKTGEDEDGDPIYEYHSDLDKIQVALNSTDPESGNTVDEIYSWYTDAVIDQVLEDLMETYGYDERTASNLIYQGGLKIYCCLDPVIQSKVDAIYEDKSNFSDYTSRNGQDLLSSATVVDNRTGAVVALAGGVGEKTGNRVWNTATDTKRPTGSSIKPLSVYAPAIEEGLLTPYSIVDDSPFKEEENGKLWPKNAQGYYRGLTSVYTSVVESLNTVAVKSLDLEGTLTAYDYLTNRFGITSLVESDIDYAPLALGGQTYGISTYEMAGAFSAFPRGGVYTEPYLYTVVLDSEGRTVLATDGYTGEMDTDGNVTISGTASSNTILSQSTCYYITNMLRGVINDSAGSGRRAAVSGCDLAGKTGTTTNDYDRWFCGYSTDYTLSVWSGYDAQEEIRSSTNPSVVLWQKVMAGICAERKPGTFAYDVETVRASYCTATGDKPSELCELAGCVATGTYVKGDEPSSTCQLHVAIKLCAESGKLAGENCLETVDGAALNYLRTGAAAKADIQSSIKTMADYEKEGVCEGETRVYGAPVFNWTADYSACQAVFTSEDGKDVQTVACSVTSVTTDPTATSDGRTVYTAKVTFQEKEYSDTKSVVIPATGPTETPGEETPGHGDEDDGDDTNHTDSHHGGFWEGLGD